jgi:MerR family copper efflux transcriptional regulator
MSNEIKIGELAARCGVSRDTIRFYEREGLLPVPRRTPSGHRFYDSEAMDRLGFIRGARRLGLTLQDIGELLRLRDKRNGEAGRQIAERLRTRAEAIDLEIAKLRVFRRLLAESLRRCEAAPLRASSVLERLFLGGRP